MVKQFQAGPTEEGWAAQTDVVAMEQQRGGGGGEAGVAHGLGGGAA